MKTKYDVGQEVGLKGKVEGISISPRGTVYKVYVDGKGNFSFREDELSEIIDFDNMGKVE